MYRASLLATACPTVASVSTPSRSFAALVAIAVTVCAVFQFVVLYTSTRVCGLASVSSATTVSPLVTGPVGAGFNAIVYTLPVVVPSTTVNRLRVHLQPRVVVLHVDRHAGRPRVVRSVAALCVTVSSVLSVSFTAVAVTVCAVFHVVLLNVGAAGATR